MWTCLSSGMASRFRKGNLFEVQEKKAKTGLKEGLLTRKWKKDSAPLQEETAVISSVPNPTV